MPRGLRTILLGQGIRAFAYGFGAVLLGVVLEEKNWSSAQTGAILTTIVAGSALASLAVGRYGGLLGRRRTYGLLFLGMAVPGVAFAFSDSWWALILAALVGTLSTEVVESGPFTSIEQAMIAGLLDRDKRTSAFGVYNAVATVAGSLGALAAGGPAGLRKIAPAAPSDSAFFLVFVAVGIAGALVAGRLGDEVEIDRVEGRHSELLKHSKGNVVKLSSLFALDSFAGGFVIQTFMVFWFRRRFGLPTEILGVVFFGVGFLQAGSFLLASRLAKRIGLLNTMVFTHLPSNFLLAAIPLAPSPAVAIALLLGRFALSQMDVPTRQAYLATLVDPEERTAAAAYTNSARTAARPIGPMLASVSQHLAFGMPFFVAGGLKAVYDLMLWAMFRRVPFSSQTDGRPETTTERLS